MSAEPLTVTRRFDATAERVFDAWLNPDTARQWLFVHPSGEIIRTDIDARVGGGFVITRRQDGVEHGGQYLTIDRPRLLVFTFGVPEQKESERLKQIRLRQGPSSS